MTTNYTNPRIERFVVSLSLNMMISCANTQQGANGVLIAKTKKAVVIALHDEKVQSGNCTNTTLKIADYLVSAGY